MPVVLSKTPSKIAVLSRNRCQVRASAQSPPVGKDAPPPAPLRIRVDEWVQWLSAKGKAVLNWKAGAVELGLVEDAADDASLTGCSIQEAEAALATLRALQATASVSGGFSEVAVDQLISQDVPQIQSLKINACATGKIAQDLAAALPQLTSLRTLSIDGCSVRSSETRALAAALPHCKALREVSLCANDIGDSGARLLAGALPSCKALQAVHLGNNRIGSAGAQALAGALSRCAKLRVLGLYGNSLGDGGACAIAAALMGCDALEMLTLGDNGIGTVGVQALAFALPAVTGLRYFQFSENLVFDEGGAMLAMGLARLPKLDKAALLHLGLSPEGTAVMKQHLAHVDSVYL